MTDVVVRQARADDLTELGELCREHAAFDTTPEEWVAPLPPDLAVGSGTRRTRGNRPPGGPTGMC